MLQRILFVSFSAYLVFILCCFSAAEGLSAPNRLSWTIKKDFVILRWRHSLADNPANGYYISVQRILPKLELDAPDFVHVKNRARQVSIRGLRPRSRYQIKVIAYSENEHEASAPVIVNTRKLAFLLAHNLTTSHVTTTSALFQWKHNPQNSVHDLDFKLKCSGTQQFTRDGNRMEEKSQFEHETPSTSHPSQSYFTNALEPNTHYTCSIVSVANHMQSIPSTRAEFTTPPGRPSPPPQPRVYLTVQDGHIRNSSFTVDLYPTDDQYGPLSHYKVLAVPVYKAEGQSRNMPYTPKFPIKQLLSHAITAHLVSKVSEPIPFVIGQYDAQSLPEKLTFDGHWMRKAFKPESYYSITVAAFTKTKDSSETLYSLSVLADPPVYIGADMQRQWVKSHNPDTIRKFVITVLATFFSVIGIFLVAFGVVFGSQYYKGRKRDAYYFSIADTDSDSSEEEIYKKSKLRGGVRSKPAKRAQEPLSAPSPNKTLAEWAVENISHNPVFERTVYRSPETMEEMDGMLQLIAHKHAQRIQALRAGGPSPLCESLTVNDQQDDPTQADTILSYLATPPPVRNETTPFLSETPEQSPVLQPLTQDSALTPLNESISEEDPLPPASTSATTDASETPIPVTYRYKSQVYKPAKPGSQRASPRVKPSPESPLPSYYYTTINPVPGTSLEEYNVTAGASPMSTVHRLTPLPGYKSPVSKQKAGKISHSPRAKLAPPKPCWDAEAMHSPSQDIQSTKITDDTQQ